MDAADLLRATPGTDPIAPKVGLRPPMEAERPILAGMVDGFVKAVVVARAIPVGGGTNDDLLLEGSSYSGGGKTGLEHERPVPDGPPPPTRLRGTTPICC